MYWFLITLILIPQVVSAECSWILWKEKNTLWEVYRAHKNYDECMRDQKELWKTVFEVAGGIEKSGIGTRIMSAIQDSSVMTVSKDGGVIAITLKCIPDTIDPRGLTSR